MMIQCYDVVTGRLGVPSEVQTIEAADLQAATQDVPSFWVEGHWNPDTEYVRARKVVSRPAVAGFDQARLMDLPAGSVVTVTNEVGDSLTITDLSEPLTLTDPGRYRFDVAPPFPFLPLTVELDHA